MLFSLVVIILVLSFLRVCVVGDEILWVKL